MKTAFLIVAGGRGSRFGGSLPKQYTPLLGKTVLRRTIEQLQSLAPDALFQTVIHPDDEQLYQASVDGLPGLLPPAHGGAIDGRRGGSGAHEHGQLVRYTYKYFLYTPLLGP